MTEHHEVEAEQRESPPAEEISEARSFWGENIKVAFLFTSIAVLFLGNGLIGTLLALRANLEGMGINTIGLMMSAYFLGYIGGAVTIPKLIQRVGHIRTFAALASVGSAVSLGHIIDVSEVTWTILRIVYGICFAGMLLVAESWLNGTVKGKFRGRILSIYSMVVMGSWAISQGALNLADASGFILFCLVSILLSLALVPITLTKHSYEGSIHSVEFRPRRLFSVSPLGITGAVISGLIAGSFFGMGPVFAQSIELDQFGVSAFMGLTMLGALVFQWPLGWLSDQIDRRKVIVGTSFATALFAIAITLVMNYSTEALLVLGLCFGSALFPLYALSVAHLNDHIEVDEIIAGASGMILLYGVGAAIGPVSSSFLMEWIGPQGLYIYAAVIAVLFGLYGLVRIKIGKPVPEFLRERFVSVPRTTYMAAELHPQAEYEDEGTESASEEAPSTHSTS